MQPQDENGLVTRARKVSVAASFGSRMSSDFFVPIVRPISLASPEVTRLIAEVRPFSSLQGLERQRGSLLVYHHSRHQSREEYSHQEQTDRLKQQQPPQSHPLDPEEPCIVTESPSIISTSSSSSCLISSFSILPTLPTLATPIPHVQVTTTEDSVDSKVNMESPTSNIDNNPEVEEVIHAHSPSRLAVSINSQQVSGQWQRQQMASRYTTVPYAGLVLDVESEREDNRSAPSPVLQQAQQGRKYPMSLPRTDSTRYPPADDSANCPTITVTVPTAAVAASSTPGKPVFSPALPRLPSQPFVIVDTATNEIITRPYGSRCPRTLTLVRGARPAISQTCRPFTDSAGLGNPGLEVALEAGEYNPAEQSFVHPVSVPLAVKNPSTLAIRPSEELIQLAAAVRIYGLGTVVLAATENSVGLSTNPARPSQAGEDVVEEEAGPILVTVEPKARKSKRHPLHPKRLFNALRGRKKATKKPSSRSELPPTSDYSNMEEVDLSGAPAFDDPSPPTKSSSFTAKCRRGWKAIRRLPKKLFGFRDKEGMGVVDSNADVGASATTGLLGPTAANTAKRGDNAIDDDDSWSFPATGRTATTTDTDTATSRRRRWCPTLSINRTRPPPYRPADQTQCEAEVPDRICARTLLEPPLEAQSSHSSRAGSTVNDPWANWTSSRVSNIETSLTLPVLADPTLSPSSSSTTAVEEVLLSQGMISGGESEENNECGILHSNNIFEAANGNHHGGCMHTRRGEESDNNEMREIEEDLTNSPNMSDSMANSASAVLQRRPPSSRGKRTLTRTRRPSSWSWPSGHVKSAAIVPVQVRASWPSFEGQSWAKCEPMWG